MPICLPPTVKFPDEKGIVYVAGWGLHHESTKSEDCTTGDKGPDPFSKCKFPFFIDNMGMAFGDCMKTKSPSHRHKGCRMLYKEMTKRKGDNVSFLEKGYGRVNTDINTLKSLIPKLTTMFNTGPDFLDFFLVFSQILL